MTTDKHEDKDNDDMTPSEREDWLRSRGIEIETPQDRKLSKNKASVLDQLSGLSLQQEDNSADFIQFVIVPHDDSKPIQTLHLPKTFSQEKVGDALPDFVKPYFADNKSIDAALLQEQATKQFAGGDLQGLAKAKISSASMNAVAAQGSVETFPLVHPADTNNYQGVYVYLDEVGLLKKLPSNARASSIAEACGFYPAPQFYGDVFIGRFQTKPKMQNVDFVAGVDTDRGATWIQRAVSENLSWQQELNQVTGKKGQTQPSQIGTEGKAAVEEKFQWTQDSDELEIVVTSLAAEGASLDKKAVKVNFLPKSLTIKYGGEEKLALQLYGGIDVDGCTWTIDGGNRLVITCEKSKSGEMWPRIQNK